MNTAAKENAEALELRAKPRPVTRLSRRVIAVLLIGAGLIVILAVAWGLKRPAPKAAGEADENRNVDHVAHAEGLASLPKDYAAVPKLGPPTGEFGRPILKAERDAGLPQLPERGDFRPNAEEEALRTQRLKEQHEAEEAAKGAVVAHLQGKSRRPLPNASAEVHSDDRRDPVSELLKGFKAQTAEGEDDESNPQDRKQAFVDKAGDAKIYASGTLQTPQSPYQLMAGTVIAAALVTGINSDLPGQVIATVTENVFDTVSGATLLIPQGARLMGQYDSQVEWGQSRVLLVWTRLILPDGSSIVLDRLPGVDAAGFAGLEDKTEWHWKRIFAGAALSSLLGASAELAAPDRNGSGNVVIAAREGIQDTINQTGQELTRRNLKIQPTLTERPGLPLRIVVNHDLILAPYRSDAS